MENVKLAVKVFMKSGGIIDEEVVLNNTKDEVKQIANGYREGIKEIFKSEAKGSITFGFTTFRISDISAVRIYG